MNPVFSIYTKYFIVPAYNKDYHVSDLQGKQNLEHYILNENYFDVKLFVDYNADVIVPEYSQ